MAVNPRMVDVVADRARRAMRVCRRKGADGLEIVLSLDPGSPWDEVRPWSDAAGIVALRYGRRGRACSVITSDCRGEKSIVLHIWNRPPQSPSEMLNLRILRFDPARA